MSAVQLAARRIRRLALLPLASLAALACSAREPSPLAQPQVDRTQVLRVHTAEGTMEAELRQEDFVARATVPGSRADAWQHLLAVWEELGLPSPTVDQPNYTLSISNHIVQRRLGRTTLSTYLDCGQSLTGANADTHRVRLSVRTLLVPVDETSTQVHTRIDASAQSIGGTSSATQSCSSRGNLEGLLSSGVRNRLRPPEPR